MSQPHVAVVGAGWSGLAAATRLVAAGCAVTLCESATTPGGRARSLDIAGYRLDNGQHLFLGAYRSTLAALREVDVEPDEVFKRQPLDLALSGHGEAFRLRLPSAPPTAAFAWALARAEGLSWCDRWRAVAAAPRLRRPPYPDRPVATWLAQTGQPPDLIRGLWAPLCLAALNTPIEQASARLFAHTLQEAFGGSGHADLLLPRCDLGHIFPEPAVRWLEARGATLHFGSRVRRIGQVDRGWRLATRHATLRADAVVLATPPDATARLLTGLGPEAATTADRLAAWPHEPIVTIWLQHDDAPPAARTLQGRLDGPAQWYFDRRQSGAPGVVSAVISGSGPHMEQCNDELGRAAIAQWTRGDPPGNASGWRVLGIIREKRATFAATPDTAELRGPSRGPLPGLWLAGDHVANELPATIEGAVRNGHDCAAMILSNKGK